jgi:hypothetical protein
MRGYTGRLLAVMGILLGGAAGRAADDAEAVQRQKDTARAIWKQLESDDALVLEETPHLLIFGSGALTPKQLRDLGGLLEARYRLARQALKVEPKETLWPGKLTVYLIGDRRGFNSFMRTVAKQRPNPDESSVLSVRGDQPFVAGCTPQTKGEPSLEAQVGEQVAAAVLVRRGGEGLPEWLIAGFGRATAWKAAPSATYSERMQVKKLIPGRTAVDVWDGKLDAREATLLRASLVDFLAYGPGAASFPKLVEAFKPEANGQPKTTAAALKAAKLDPADLNRKWLGFVLYGSGRGR